MLQLYRNNKVNMKRIHAKVIEIHGSEERYKQWRSHVIDTLKNNLNDFITAPDSEKTIRIAPYKVFFNTINDFIRINSDNEKSDFASDDLYNYLLNGFSHTLADFLLSEQQKHILILINETTTIQTIESIFDGFFGENPNNELVRLQDFFDISSLSGKLDIQSTKKDILRLLNSQHLDINGEYISFESLTITKKYELTREILTSRLANMHKKDKNFYEHLFLTFSINLLNLNFSTVRDPENEIHLLLDRIFGDAKDSKSMDIEHFPCFIEFDNCLNTDQFCQKIIETIQITNITQEEIKKILISYSRDVTDDFTFNYLVENCSSSLFNYTRDNTSQKTFQDIKNITQSFFSTNRSIDFADYCKHSVSKKTENRMLFIEQILQTTKENYKMDKNFLKKISVDIIDAFEDKTLSINLAVNRVFRKIKEDSPHLQLTQEDLQKISDYNLFLNNKLKELRSANTSEEKAKYQIIEKLDSIASEYLEKIDTEAKNNAQPATTENNEQRTTENTTRPSTRPYEVFANNIRPYVNQELERKVNNALYTKELSQLPDLLRDLYEKYLMEKLGKFNTINNQTNFSDSLKKLTNELSEFYNNSLKLAKKIKERTLKSSETEVAAQTATRSVNRENSWTNSLANTVRKLGFKLPAAPINQTPTHQPITKYTDQEANKDIEELAKELLTISFFINFMPVPNITNDNQSQTAKREKLKIQNNLLPALKKLQELTPESESSLKNRLKIIEQHLKDIIEPQNTKAAQDDERSLSSARKRSRSQSSHAAQLTDERESSLSNSSLVFGEG